MTTMDKILTPGTVEYALNQNYSLGLDDEDIETVVAIADWLGRPDRPSERQMQLVEAFAGRFPAQ